MKLKKLSLGITLALAATGLTSTAQADEFTKALTEGKTSANFNFRFETVDQDNALKRAKGLTLRSRLTYATGDYKGFSSVIEFEDSRTVAGVGDYNDTIGGGAGHSVIADPNTTEVDQLLVQYKTEQLTAKFGRQVITMDNHRFVGHVGWRQDRQTFDGATFAYSPTKELKLQYGYLTQRNRIFAQEKDLKSKDHLLNASYKTSLGTLTGYGYLLEVDNNVENGLDTYGLRFNGATKFGEQKVSYSLEYATQDSDTASTSYTANYLLAEIGTSIAAVNFKLGYELLGSDDGMYGFSTPLATLHKFNGWSDQFLGTPKEGLKDLYASAGGKVGGGKWALVYHKFDADEASATVDDLGSEFNALYTKAFSKNYSAGIKLAIYAAGDSTAGKVDTDKVWIWMNAKF